MSNQKEQRLGLSQGQRKTLEFIRDFIDEHNYSPSYKEIAKGLNTPQSNAYRYACILHERGYIVKSNCDRSINIVSE